MPAPYPYSSEGIRASHVHKGTGGVTINATGFYGLNLQSEAKLDGFVQGLVSVQ